MEPVHPRVRAAHVEQLARRRETMAAGASHVGWKLGIGDRERIEGSIAVGYLTSATTIQPGGAYRGAGLTADLHADAEVAVELRRDVSADERPESARGAIAGFGVALELVDLAPVLADAVAVVAVNIFHRAVAFGPTEPRLPEPPLRARAYVNGEFRGAGEAHDDLGHRIVAAARVLDSAGERLRAGDRVITGSIVQIPVSDGLVRAELVGLGAVELEVVP